MTVIRGLILSIGVLMLASACARPADPCGTKFGPGNEVTPVFCPPDTIGPKFAVIAVGIICGTILLTVLALVVAHLSTGWRHADEDK